MPSPSITGGRIRTWREEGMDIFFPQQKLIIDGQEKLRGGMHVCFPSFGPVDKKFGLPQHGRLRDLRGIKRSSNWELRGSDLLGCFNQPISVSISAIPQKRGFRFSIFASLKKEATAAVPIGMGLHPYFSTPQGYASTGYYGERFEGTPQTVVRKLELSDYVRRQYFYEITIHLKDLGTVKMNVGGDFLKVPNPAVVFWRDDPRYLCVEPVMALPEDYGTERCLWLKPGEHAYLSCDFEFFGKGFSV